MFICLNHLRQHGLKVTPENVAVLLPVDEVNAEGNPIITFYVQIDAENFLDSECLSQAIYVSHATTE